MQYAYMKVIVAREGGFWIAILVVATYVGEPAGNMFNLLALKNGDCGAKSMVLIA
jgi:hypothetical protein